MFSPTNYWTASISHRGIFNQTKQEKNMKLNFLNYAVARFLL